MAADFEDAMGATDQVFKENAKVVQDWASNLPSMYGIAKKEALEYANIMGSMLVNIGGLTQEQAETIRFVNTVSWRLNGYVRWYNTGCREGFNGCIEGQQYDAR